MVDQKTFFTKQVASHNISNYLVVQPGDLVYNKSASKEAPFGVVARLTGGEPGVVTPLYFVFRADPDWVLPDFLELACNSSLFFDSLSGQLREGARSHGALNVRLEEFFSAQFLLPPLPVQHRVVDVVGTFDRLRRDQQQELLALQQLLVSVREQEFARLWRDAPAVRLGDLIREVKRPVTVRASDLYSQVGVRSHGRGVFEKEAMSGQELGSKKVFWVEPGDLVLNIVFAWEGAVAVIPERLESYCASHRFPTYRRTDSGPIDYVRQLLLSANGLQALSVASPGGAGRNRTLNRKRLLEVEVPFPAEKQQRELSEVLDALEANIDSAIRERDSIRTARRALSDEILAGIRPIGELPNIGRLVS